MFATMREALYIAFVWCCIQGALICHAARLYELNAHFLDLKDKHEWLVHFYEPFNKQSKRLEPVWLQVAQRLDVTELRVGRLDCDQYPSVARLFRIVDYPTVLYISKDKIVEYHGERALDPILEFVRRVHGPAMKKPRNCNEMKMILNWERRQDALATFLLGNHSNGHGEAEELIKNFTQYAERIHPHNYFLDAPMECLDKLKNHSWIYVYKNRKLSPYDPEKYDSLDRFIYIERFPAFQRLGFSNFHEVIAAGKMIVAAVLLENDSGKLATSQMRELRYMLEALALNTRMSHHDKFLFGWFYATDIPFSIAMTELPLPSVIVFDPQTHKYYLSNSTDDPDEILKLLDAIAKADPLPPSFGGNELSDRMYRSCFDITQKIKKMSRSAPVLTFVVFLIPTAFLIAIAYFTCCSDFRKSSGRGVGHEKRE